MFLAIGKPTTRMTKIVNTTEITDEGSTQNEEVPKL
jgi:hypothetical protein